MTLSLSPQCHASLLSFLIFLPTLACKLQGALLLPHWHLALNFPYSLLQTAKHIHTGSRLRSLPALPVPYGLLTSSYWIKEAWLGLLTKQLLWKEKQRMPWFQQQFRLHLLHCHFMAAFSVSNSVNVLHDQESLPVDFLRNSSSLGDFGLLKK